MEGPSPQMSTLTPASQSPTILPASTPFDSNEPLHPLSIGGDSTLRTSIVGAKVPVTNSLSTSTDASNIPSQNDAMTANLGDGASDFGAFYLSGQSPQPKSRPNTSKSSPQLDPSPGKDDAGGSRESFPGSNASEMQNTGSLSETLSSVTSPQQIGSSVADGSIPIASGAAEASAVGCSGAECTVSVSGAEVYAAASSAATSTGNAAPSSLPLAIPLSGGAASTDPSALASAADTPAGGSVRGAAGSSPAGTASYTGPGALAQASNTAVIPPTMYVADLAPNGPLASPIPPQANAGQAFNGQLPSSTQSHASIGVVSNGQVASPALSQTNIDIYKPQESSATQLGNLVSEASTNQETLPHTSQNNLGGALSNVTASRNLSPTGDGNPVPTSLSAEESSLPNSTASSMVDIETAASNQAFPPVNSSFRTVGDSAPSDKLLPNPKSITASPHVGNNTNDPLSHSDFVAPLSQSPAVLNFLENVLRGQPNIPAFERKLEARLGGYLNDYIASHDNIQQPNGGLTNASETVEMQNLGGQSCNNLTLTHETMVTDIYIMEVIVNTTYQHYQQVRDIIGYEC